MTTPRPLAVTPKTHSLYMQRSYIQTTEYFIFIYILYVISCLLPLTTLYQPNVLFFFYLQPWNTCWNYYSWQSVLPSCLTLASKFFKKKTLKLLCIKAPIFNEKGYPGRSTFLATGHHAYQLARNTCATDHFWTSVIHLSCTLLC